MARGEIGQLADVHLGQVASGQDAHAAMIPIVTKATPGAAYSGSKRAVK